MRVLWLAVIFTTLRQHNTTLAPLSLRELDGRCPSHSHLQDELYTSCIPFAALPSKREVELEVSTGNASAAVAEAERSALAALLNNDTNTSAPSVAIPKDPDKLFCATSSALDITANLSHTTTTHHPNHLVIFKQMPISLHLHR